MFMMYRIVEYINLFGRTDIINIFYINLVKLRKFAQHESQSYRMERVTIMTRSRVDALFFQSCMRFAVE